MKFLLPLLLCLSLSIEAFAPLTTSVTNGINFVKLQYLTEVMEKAKLEQKIIFLDFYNDACKPCKYMDRYIFTDQSVAEFYNENFISFKINVDYQQGRLLSQKFNIQGLPTMITLTPQGTVIAKRTGLAYVSSMMHFGKWSVANKNR